MSSAAQHSGTVPTSALDRRGFLHTAGRTAAVSAGVLAGLRMPAVHAAGSDEIRLALVGCGGRGGGAAVDALSVPNSRVKIYAMADVFPERIDGVKRSLEQKHKEQLDVPAERTFLGFEAYKRAMDALRPGDIALCATPPAFRAAHFAYAIEKGLHFFMEKPAAVDGPSAKRIIELAPKADAKKLKVGVGLMCRHCDSRNALFERLRAGEAGDLIAFRGYREHGPIHNLDLAPGVPKGMTELQWQVRRFHNFLWGSGGVFSDYFIHHIDEACWMKDAWPVTAEAVGGRHFQGKINDQNFDSYGVEYTFADGAKFFYHGRTMKGTPSKFGVFGQGSKGAFTISGSGHSPARSAIYKSQRIEKDNVAWAYDKPEASPYRREWEHLVDAIVNDKPYNEAVRGAEASLVTAMGRFAAHTGRPVTYQEMLDSPDDMTAGVAQLTDESPAPLVADKDGRYPVPMPGQFKFEYHN